MGWVTAAFALAGALASVLAFAAWRRRGPLLRWWRLRREPYRTRYPVLLVHGVMGFDQVTVRGKSYAYFRGVEEHLEALGTDVRSVRLPSLSSVEVRARALAEIVERTAAPKVNLVAHSMGGLDARYAIARHGLASRVASLVTIGTPHRGTPLADAGTRLLDRLGLRAILRRIGSTIDAFDDLTSERTSRLNEELLDVRSVFYGSVIARVPPSGPTHPLLRPTHRYLAGRAGDNDGLVPAASQAWGEVILEIEVDHWAQVGWSVSSDVDARDVYAAIVRELKARGR
ncbi:MAG: lipase family alpha/beta hydrolase [Sandaracinaceae bacterium]